MSRHLRPYMPGAPFHITARINNGEMLLHDPQDRDFLLEVIAGSLRRSDARIIALTIMTNHFHLIVRQGRAQLAQLMQPILCRTALHLNRKLQRKGHIFATPYWAGQCLDPHYLRTMIIYTHLNPRRAGLCDDLRTYRWTSHSYYCGHETNGSFPLTPCLEVFAEKAGESEEQWRANYLKFFNAQMLHDDSATSNEVPHVPALSSDGGDLFWTREFARSGNGHHALIEGRVDLRDIARSVLAEHAPDLTVDLLREPRHDRRLPGLRRKIITRGTMAGYRPYELSRFLGISMSWVSRVGRDLENRPPTEYGPRRARRLGE